MLHIINYAVLIIKKESPLIEVKTFISNQIHFFIVICGQLFKLSTVTSMVDESTTRFSWFHGSALKAYQCYIKISIAILMIHKTESSM